MRRLLKRGLAYLIDCTICYSLLMLIGQWAIISNIRETIGITDEWFRDSLNTELYVLITISLPVWIYFTYFDSNRSKGTFGKRMMNLSVRNSADRERITLGRSFKRTFFKLLPWEIAHIGVIFPTPLYFMEEPEVRFLTILGILLLVGFALSILFDAHGRSIYDRLAGTEVIDK